VKQQHNASSVAQTLITQKGIGIKNGYLSNRFIHTVS